MEAFLDETDGEFAKEIAERAETRVTDGSRDERGCLWFLANRSDCNLQE